MRTPRIETKRLLLREIEETDVNDIFNCWMQDEDVSRYMCWKASNDRKDAKEFVEFELGNLDNAQWNRWIIVLQETREIIGTCLIFYNDEEENWDISYNLGKKYWGKGYVTEAMREVMKYAVDEMKIKECIAIHAVENPASGRVMEKLGFRHEKEVPYECNGGTIHTTGKYYRFQVEEKEMPSYFIEGLQGSGKSTLAGQLSRKMPGYEVFREGDYSPVELAWCAYVTEEQYESILRRYHDLMDEIQDKTVREEEHRIISYTQILTDIEGFHKEMGKYEIYNGNWDRETFEHIILHRFEKWNGVGQIFECSIFQNIIENQLLYLMMKEDEILDFYRKVKKVLADKSYKIIYLDVENVHREIEIIRKERVDHAGNELWFPLMVQYMEQSPYGKKHSLRGMDGLVRHFERRKKLEHRILHDIFKENAILVKEKGGYWKTMRS